MKKYLAISIGPIIKTFTMARKSKEYWTASYMFSYLMQCILKVLTKETKLKLVSPFYKDGKVFDKSVGLFPDRAFFEVTDDIDIISLLATAKEQFIKDTEFTKNSELNTEVVDSYFRIMHVFGKYNSCGEAISGLNKALDRIELNQTAWTPNDYDVIFSYLRTANNECPLYQIAFGTYYNKIPTLETIAKGEVNEKSFSRSKESSFSYQRYICIVQADGDSMGTIVSSFDNESELLNFSEQLIGYGQEACKKISAFGGLPIYAGGDDLLFIAPVCGKEGKTIFDLIGEIDEEYEQIQKIVEERDIEIDKDGEKIKVRTSMSYGISIIYYKYPLYEAWEIARNMLFEVAKKQVDGKNAIVLNLRKNSGSDFRLAMSKSGGEFPLLKSLIDLVPGESLVSSVAHKVRANEPLLSTFDRTDLSSRLKAFFDKIIDIEDKSIKAQSYIGKTREMLEFIMNNYIGRKPMKAENGTEKSATQQATELFYSILRIAKFIKGEEVKDE